MLTLSLQGKHLNDTDKEKKLNTDFFELFD